MKLNLVLSYFATHVVIIAAVVTEVAWNVNKFCVYVFAIPHFMLSNIADTVNKQTMTMTAILHKIYMKWTLCKSVAILYKKCH